MGLVKAIFRRLRGIVCDPWPCCYTCHRPWPNIDVNYNHHVRLRATLATAAMFESAVWIPSIGHTPLRVDDLLILPPDDLAGFSNRIYIGITDDRVYRIELEDR